MKQAAHSTEDKLLEFAYGELAADEARALEAHVQGCARCTESLAAIQGVRQTMSKLTVEEPPDAGLESLLAYAQQAARRTQAGPALRPVWWRRLMIPAAAVCSLLVVTGVGLRVAKQLDPHQVAMESAAASKSEPSPAQAPPAAAASPTPVPSADEDWSRDRPEIAARLDDLAQRGKADAFAEGANAPELKRRRSQESVELTSKGLGTRGAPAKLQTRDEESGLLDQKLTEKQFDARRKDGAAADALAGAGDGYGAVGTLGGGGGRLSKEEAQAQPAPPKSRPYIQGNSVEDAPSTRRPPSSSMGSARELEAYVEEDDRGPVDAAPAPPVVTAEAAPREPAKKKAQDKQSEAKPARPPVAERTVMEPGGGKEKRSSVTVDELVRQAESARRSGNRPGEAALLRQALALGVSGNTRLNLLSQLCEAERVDLAGTEACKAVVREFPNSSPAELARRRIREFEKRAAPDNARE